MNACATCKHLGPPIVALSEYCEAQETGAPIFGISVQQAAIYRVCTRINSAQTGAAFVVGSERMAFLCVSEAFGCNQWEPK